MNPTHLELRLQTNEIALLGYGSLLSRESMSKTLKSIYDGPVISCRVDGWQRAWNVCMPNSSFFYLEGNKRIYPENIVYLNATPSNTNFMNAMLFVINKCALEKINQREWIYSLQPVIPFIESSPLLQIEAMMYVGRNEYITTKCTHPYHTAIRSSYVQLVEQALSLTDTIFQNQFYQTTSDIPSNCLVDDILDSSRPNPWALAGFDYDP